MRWREAIPRLLLVVALAVSVVLLIAFMF